MALQTFVGTPMYMAPEVLQSVPYSHNSDIWSLGHVMYELCTLETLYQASTLQSLIEKVRCCTHSSPRETPSVDLSAFLDGGRVRVDEGRHRLCLLLLLARSSACPLQAMRCGQLIRCRLLMMITRFYNLTQGAWEGCLHFTASLTTLVTPTSGCLCSQASTEPTHKRTVVADTKGEDRWHRPS